MIGISLVLVAHDGEPKCLGEGTLDYLVVEVGHRLLGTARQSGRKVRGAPDVAHLVVPIVKLGVRVVRLG